MTWPERSGVGLNELLGRIGNTLKLLLPLWQTAVNATTCERPVVPRCFEVLAMATRAAKELQAKACIRKGADPRHCYDQAHPFWGLNHRQQIDHRRREHETEQPCAKEPSHSLPIVAPCINVRVILHAA